MIGTYRKCIRCGALTEGAVLCPGSCKPAAPKPAPKAETHSPKPVSIRPANEPSPPPPPVVRHVEPAPSPTGRMKCGCRCPHDVPGFVAADMVCKAHAGESGVTDPDSPEAMAIAQRVYDDYRATAAKPTSNRKPQSTQGRELPHADLSPITHGIPGVDVAVMEAGSPGSAKRLAAVKARKAVAL